MGGYAPTLGGLLLGSLLNTYFYGIVFMQVVAYFGMKFDDPFWVKVFVASLFCLDSVNAASLVYGVWWFAVENHNNPQALRILLWPLPFTIMVITLVAFMVQTFLAYRLLRLTQSKLRYVIVMLLSLLAFMAGLVVSVTTLQVRSQGRNESVRAETGITVWLASEVGVDISLTAMLVAVLLPRSGGTFHKSNTLVNRLIRGAVQTGSIFALLCMALFIQYPTAHYYAIGSLSTAHLYTITIMDTLLVRHRLRELVSGNMVNSSEIWGLETWGGPSSRPTDASIQLSGSIQLTNFFGR